MRTKNASKKNKENKIKRKRSPSVKHLRDKAWRILSEYIRLKYANHAGYVECVTCGVVKKYNEMHAGHFLHGKNKKTYFVVENIHPQCPQCNHFKSGNLQRYTLYMLAKYGKKKINNLFEEHEKPHTWTKSDLEGIIEDYRKKLKDVKYRKAIE